MMSIVANIVHTMPGNNGVRFASLNGINRSWSDNLAEIFHDDIDHILNGQFLLRTFAKATVGEGQRAPVVINVLAMKSLRLVISFFDFYYNSELITFSK
ncbi:MAG: hypothetical protein WDO15_00020 [Bacteroidota bacterium]